MVFYTVDQKENRKFSPPESNYKISPHIELISTPGHTPDCISVKVTNVVSQGTVVISGDLFEKEGDIQDPSLWMAAGSFDEKVQRNNRLRMATEADCIIPGHGPMFKVTEEHKTLLANQIQ